jgi:RNA polymerase sigma-70 factor (ECF subfamily)
METINRDQVSGLQNKIALHRDMQAYQQLYKILHKPLIRFATSMIDSKEVAEEIFSDLMLKIWHMEEKLAAIENLNVYLFRSIRNASLNYLQKNNRVRLVELNDGVNDKAGTGFLQDEVLRNEFQSHLLHAVEALPPRCKMVYLLIKEEGMTYRQVSDVLGITVNTIEGHMTVALKRITQCLRTYLNSGY